MENVTFKPVLVARKKSVGCLNSRNNADGLGDATIGYPNRVKLYETNVNNEMDKSI